MVDPDLTAIETVIIWRPELDPDVLCLMPGPYRTGDRRVCAAPERWRGSVETRAAGGGLHAALDSGAGRHRLYLPADADGPDKAELGVWLPLDRFFAERAEAALSFWRSAADPPVSSHPLRCPAVPRKVAARRRLILRALDGDLAGASYRQIAATVLGRAEPMSACEWKSSSTRAVAIRLVAAGRRLMEGDYRQLLLPPKRRPRGTAEGVDTVRGG